jgi:predicted kinase
MLNLPATARTGARPNEGPYSASTTRRVYKLCLGLADAPVSDGWPVIIDAAALKAWQRAAAAGKAAEMGVPFCLLSCEADASVVEKRVGDRQQKTAEVSEADLAVLRHQLANAEPLADTEAAAAIRIRTDQKIDWPVLIKRIEEASS